ncbi:MAG TPA: ornithine cyclodeaminase family protein [Actinomycetota bacterium]|nr:ornithine cyclodeaminase family protein [Actinomycetota bacterium]
MTTILVLREEEIRRAATRREALEVVREAFGALARGEARLPDVIYMDIQEFDGDVHVKGAHMKGSPHFSVKVAGGWYGNPERGLPVGGGLVAVFSAETGVPEALLLDNGFLTDLRTGAAGALAAEHLARPSLRKVAMIGAGLEARFQLRALADVRVVGAAVAWSRTRPRAEAFAREMAEELGIDVAVADDVESAVRDADLVVTATPSRGPLVRAEWLAPGVHVTALGSDGPDKQELDVGVLARADVLVVDDREQSSRKGELHHALEAGAVTPDRAAAELGDLVLGRHPGRTADDQVTVCDLTGLGVQDVAVASLALERARAMGLGTALES